MFERIRLLYPLGHELAALNSTSCSASILPWFALRYVSWRWSLRLSVFQARIVVRLLQRFVAVLVVDQSWWQNSELSVFVPSVASLVETANCVLQLGLHCWVCAGVETWRCLLEGRSGILRPIYEFVEHRMLVMPLKNAVCSAISQVERHVLRVATVLQIPLEVQRHWASLLMGLRIIIRHSCGDGVHLALWDLWLMHVVFWRLRHKFLYLIPLVCGDFHHISIAQNAFEAKWLVSGSLWRTAITHDTIILKIHGLCQSLVYFDSLFNGGRVSSSLVLYIEAGRLERYYLVIHFFGLGITDACIYFAHGLSQIETFLIFDFVLRNAVTGQDLAWEHLGVVKFDGVVEPSRWSA